MVLIARGGVEAPHRDEAGVRSEHMGALKSSSQDELIDATMARHPTNPVIKV